MNKIEQKKDIKKDIKYLKATGYEELYRVLIDALSVYFECLKTFGLKNPYTKECFKVVVEIKQVLKEERRLLTLLNNHIDWINLDDLEYTIGELDELNENTYFDYSNILDNIQFACETQDKERIVRNNKPINSLISNNEYKEKIYNLIQKGSIKK